MKSSKKSEAFGIWKRLVPEQKLREAMELYPGKSRMEVQEILCREVRGKVLPGMGVMIILLFLAVAVSRKTLPEREILRPAPGEAEVSEQLRIKMGEDWKTLELPVGAREYTEEEIEKLHRETEDCLESVIWGENEAPDRIRTKLVLPSRLPGGESIYWSTDAPWLVESDGTVQNEELDATEQVQLMAEISYGQERRYFTRIITVCPKEYVGEEAVLHQALSELKQQEESTRNAEQFVVPEAVLGYSLERTEKSGYRTAGFLCLLAVVIPVFLYSACFSSLDSRRKQRKEAAEAGYMQFVTKLSLMMAAGISVRQAFYRLAEEYEKNYGAEHVLAAELKVLRQELENGYSESEVYDAFGRRLGILPYQRMASLLTQNVSKGVQGIRMLLLQEAKEVMAQERAGIRARGEQAGTRLLLPMMGLLFLVFAILLVPAFLSF